MKVHAVNFRRKRHSRTAKEMLKDVCGVIEDINCEVAGYAVFAWTDDGTTGWAFKTGRPVSGGGLSVHLTTKVEKSMADQIERRR